MTDYETLSNELHLTTNRIRFILPPRTIQDPPDNSDASIALRAANLSIRQAISDFRNSFPSIEIPDITPFNWHERTPTFLKIWKACDQIRTASRFDTTPPPDFRRRVREFRQGDRVRLIGLPADLEDYGIEDPPGILGTIDNRAEEVDVPGWDVDFDNGNSWYVRDENLELVE